MNTSAIPVCRATSLIPYVDFLADRGVRVERELERDRLPPGIAADPGGVVSTRHNWAFIDRMARQEGIEDLGLRVACRARYSLLSPAMVARLASCSTVHSSMRSWIDAASGESSGMRCEIERCRGGVNFVLHKTFGPGVPGYGQTEWLGLMAMIHVVRICAGPDWQPPVISLRSPEPEPVPRLAAELFGNARLLAGQSRSFVFVPAQTLWCRPDRALLPESAACGPGLGPPSNLIESLERLLVPYLAAGYPSVELAAELANVSVRTLQRRLDDAGRTYSRLVHDLRMELAVRLLVQGSHSVVEVAQQTGYRDASNFARAFRRRTGLSPSGFRTAAGHRGGLADSAESMDGR